MGKSPPNTVKVTGAEAGQELIGVLPLNKGMIVRIERKQIAGPKSGGAIVGSFTLLDAGSGTYSEHLASHLHMAFPSADTLLDMVAASSGKPVKHFLNRNTLRIHA